MSWTVPSQIVVVSAAVATALTVAPPGPLRPADPPPAVERAIKGDRLVRAPRVHAARPVGSIEVQPGLLVVRDAAGGILFQSDAAARTTLIARDVSIPAVTVAPVPGVPTPASAPPAPTRRPAPAGPTRFALEAAGTPG